MNKNKILKRIGLLLVLPEVWRYGHYDDANLLAKHSCLIFKIVFFLFHSVGFHYKVFSSHI